MRKTIYIVLISILASAITSYFVVTNVVEKQETAKKESTTHLVSESELVLSGNLRKHFYSSAPSDFTSAAMRSKPSVVGINAFQQDEGASRDQLSKSSGSGVIISEDGYIVTNNHVIEDAVEISVLLDDNREFIGKLIGSDPATDLALMKIEATNLTPLIYGNSDSLLIGEWVMAIGNPFKLQTTVTAGIVSAKARDINILARQGIESFIQTDAAVNPGNSGGALVNTNGELVGINTAIISQSGRYEGFSFAVPVNLVQKVVYDIIEYGAVQRGWMGIGILDVDDQIAKRLKLEKVGGVYVNVVERNSAAADAGLINGDVIISINDKDTPRIPIFMEEVGKHRPGDKVQIEYVRQGEVYAADVILRNQLNTTDFIAVRKDPILLDLGFEVRDLDSKEQDYLPKKGAYVVSIYRNKTIANTNMEPGYIITSLNGNRISSASELVNQLQNSKGSVILEGYYENYVGNFPYTFNMPQ